MAKQIVIIGGGYSGLMAAVRAARQLRGRADVTVVNASEQFVERIRLHQAAAAETLRRWSIPELLAPSGARLRVGRVEAIDLERKELRLAPAGEPQGAPAGEPQGEHSSRAATGGQTLVWDQLVLAPGSHTDRERVPGTPELRAHVHTLDAGADARLRAALPALAERKGSLVVVGGGLTGIEAASELAERWPLLRVTLLASGGLEPRLSEAARAHVRRALTRLGVTLVEDARAQLVTARAVETERGPLPADACLWAGGFAASPLLRQAGLTVNERGQALVDSSLRALGHADVYVAGDAAALTEGPRDVVAMSCKAGVPMAAHAADNLVRALASRVPEPFRFGDTGVCLSLGRWDGLVDLRRADGSTTGRVFTGRTGAWLKERISRYPLWSIRMESRGWWRFRWVQASPRDGAKLGAGADKRLAA